jgi:hypothetical protein
VTLAGFQHLILDLKDSARRAGDPADTRRAAAVPVR